MDKTLKTFIGFILFIFFLGVILAPGMAQRKASSSAQSLVKTVLNYWKNGDAASGKALWLNQSRFPDIYDLKSYTIQKTSTEKIGKKDFLTKVHVQMHFNPNSLMPDEKVWVFEIQQKKRVNAVSDFYLLKDD